jgi:cyclic dehypoxanthinyl futalosine synthase
MRHTKLAHAQILDEVLSGRRMSEAEALELWVNGDWTQIAAAGYAKRVAMHGDEAVTYTAFRVINYTNYCDVECSFCSFMDEVGSGKGYNLSLEQMEQKAREALDLGADQIFLQGGVNPELPLSYYTEALELFQHQLGMHVRAFSPVELWRMSEIFKISRPELLELLKQHGLGSVPGAGAEILGERMRSILSPKKLSASQWCQVMGEAHAAGLPGSANIVFGSVETAQEIIEHLTYVRTQQDLSGGFLSFVPWIFQQQTKKFTVRHVRGDEYLKMLGLCRLFLDNIPHLEVSVMVMGRELAELGLRSGADDISSIVIEENVLASKGLKTLKAAESFITRAGFRAQRRNLSYETAQY